MLFLDFVLWPSRSLPYLAYSPWFFFSANSLTSFRSFYLRSPVWVLFRPCTQVLLTRFITPTYFSLCHHLFLDYKFPTTSFFHGRMMSPPWFGRQLTLLPGNLQLSLSDQPSISCVHYFYIHLSISFIFYSLSPSNSAVTHGYLGTSPRRYVLLSL